MDLEEYAMWLARESLQRHGESRQDLEWGRTRALISAAAGGKNNTIERHLLYEPQQTKDKLKKQIDAAFSQINAIAGA